MNSPEQTMYVCTIKILLDPRLCNATVAGACDWMSETLRNLEVYGLVDWGYLSDPKPVYVPHPYKEGDFLSASAAENVTSALQCALADLIGSFQAHSQNNSDLHDWGGHTRSIEELCSVLSQKIPEELCLEPK